MYKLTIWPVSVMLSLPPRLGLFWSDRPYFSAAVVPGFLTDSVIKIHTYNESPHQLQSFTKFCYQEVEKCTDNFKWLQKGVQISNQGSFSLYASHSFVNMSMSYDRITFCSNTAKTGEEIMHFGHEERFSNLLIMNNLTFYNRGKTF